MQQKMATLKNILGILPEDESEIVQNQPFLQQQRRTFYQKMQQWIARHRLVEPDDGRRLFLDGFFDSLIAGVYDETFYTRLYHQTLHWYHLGLTESDVLLLLSQVRQQLVRHGEPLQNDRLAHALCLVVDLSMNLVIGVYQLSREMQGIRQKSEDEFNRINQAFSLLAASLPRDLIQAYTNYQQWKFIAISLALGNPLEQQQLPPVDHCHLSHWLQQGGMEIIDPADREGFNAAHQRIHELIELIRQQALLHRPEQISRYLGDLEQASDVVSQVLLECIDKSISELATHDVLTKLRNRTTLEGFFQRERALARRLNQRLGVLLIDIDHFKTINDRFGHLTGDCVLVELSQLLTRQVRQEDALFRWGGEEFLVIGMVDRDAVEGMAQLAERIRKATEQTCFHASVTPMHLTISAGVVEFPAAMEVPMHEIFARADKLLYQAKQQGRNRVQCVSL